MANSTCLPTWWDTVLSRVLFSSLATLTLVAFFLVESQAYIQTTFNSGAGLFWAQSETTLNLRLGCPAPSQAASPQPLPCWDDVVSDAVNEWNHAGAAFEFFITSPSIATDPCDHSDRVNTLAFENTVCGTAFGSAIAITISRGNGSTGELIDTDILFDTNRAWSTYSGPLQASPLDLRRVAVHELGHVLGLGHPDQAGQNTVSIMNSFVSSTDSLQPDDINGIIGIYSAADSPMTPVGSLENPGFESSASGVSALSGWVCDTDHVTLEIDGQSLQAAYGTTRGDTLPVCGDTNNGFSLLVNWNLFGDGPHTIVAFADGEAFATTTFRVTTIGGQEFIQGASSQANVAFDDHVITLQWQESLQNFVIIQAVSTTVPQPTPGNSGGQPPTLPFPVVSDKAFTGALENPLPNSYASGVNAISGWVCDANEVIIEIDGQATQAGYGTTRGDTLSICGDSDNGFSLLVNWNLLGDGGHTIRAIADGDLFATAVFSVTTIGGQEFIQGATGQVVIPFGDHTLTLEWEESLQNFVIIGVE